MEMVIIPHFDLDDSNQSTIFFFSKYLLRTGEVFFPLLSFITGRLSNWTSLYAMSVHGLSTETPILMPIYFSMLSDHIHFERLTAVQQYRTPNTLPVHGVLGGC